MPSKAGREKIRAVSKISSCQVYAICRQGIVKRGSSLVSIFLLLLMNQKQPGVTIIVAGLVTAHPALQNSINRLQQLTELTMNLLTDVLSAFSWGGQEVSGDLLLLFLHCKRVILCLLHNPLDLSILLTVMSLYIPAKFQEKNAQLKCTFPTVKTEQNISLYFRVFPDAQMNTCLRCSVQLRKKKGVQNSKRVLSNTEFLGVSLLITQLRTE